MKEEVKKLRESILARLGTMDEMDLKKVLGFLEKLETQKEQKRGED